MTNFELSELIRKEENTLCSIPWGPEFKARRQALTEQTNKHVEMLCTQLHAQANVKKALLV